ncbi:hypothetical protein IJ22_17570 [Paenibacillus naphthalenovorans]|uniref:Uncharacterized protein n=1 Tax=Paenibacillus naphthalenovorans TaxID=162209 RepID=A0A0U2VF34_9BACL|nr:hypothetical protein IJ22_17570 [Paenibacillus naphthalenovorans]
MFSYIMVLWLVLSLSTYTVIMYQQFRSKEWKYTWSHLFWFVYGIIFTVIPYEYMLHQIQLK